MISTDYQPSTRPQRLQIIMDTSSNTEYDLKLFPEILKNIHIGLVLLDMKEDKISYCNKQASLIADSCKIDCDYQAFYKLLTSAIKQLQKSADGHEERLEINHGDRFISYVLTLLSDDELVCVLLQDITDQKRMDSIAEGAVSMNNMGYIFSGIRHEIGNPLNSIKMALTVLKNNMDRYSPKEIKVYFNRVFEDIGRVEQLLKSFKNFNMYETPKTDIMDLSDFIMHNTQLITAYSGVKDKMIGISVDVDPGSEWVKVDRRALQQVTMNLLANAMDAMHHNPEARLKISSKARGNNILLQIKDNGCGIPQETLDDIFKPFFTTKEKGTGLGLALSKKMLSQMSCGIEVSSIPDMGTTFTISIPKARDYEVEAYQNSK